MTTDPVSLRSNYGHRVYQRRYKVDKPRDRRLWCKLVIAFTVSAFVGVCCILTGGIFLPTALEEHYATGGTSLPLTVCSFSLVSGLLIIATSILIGNMMISKKWRKKKQYGRQRIDPVLPDNGANISEGLPPDYNSVVQTDQNIYGQQAVFFIMGPNREHLSPPPGYSEEPPGLPGYTFIKPSQTQQERNREQANNTT